LKLNKKYLFLLPKAAFPTHLNHSRYPVCAPPRDAQTTARQPEIQPAHPQKIQPEKMLHPHQ
jgi:hypothetical protein